MIGFYSFLHFLGLSFLVGGEPLVAMMAIKGEKDDNALSFFVSFLNNIVIFMWIGMALAFIGGIGMFYTLELSLNNLLIAKIILFIIVAIVSLLLLFRVSKVKAAAAENFASLRENVYFKQMDILSRIDLILILCILVISVIM